MWTVLFTRLAWVHFQMGSTHEVFGWRAEHLCRKNRRSTGEEEAKLESFLNGEGVLYPDWPTKESGRQKCAQEAFNSCSSQRKPVSANSSAGQWELFCFSFCPLSFYSSISRRKRSQRQENNTQATTDTFLKSLAWCNRLKFYLL